MKNRYTGTPGNGTEFQLLCVQGEVGLSLLNLGQVGHLLAGISGALLHFRFVEELGFPPTCYLFSTCDTVEDCGQQCKYSILGRFMR